MRVRIQRTCTVPADGVGGLPKRNVRSRMTLTVGGGYDLDDKVAKDLIERGLAARVEVYEKPDPVALRDGRRARVELQRVTRENGDLRSQVAEREDELATAREEIVRLRGEIAAATGELETVYMIRVAGADEFVSALLEDGTHVAGDIADGLSYASPADAEEAIGAREGLEVAEVGIGATDEETAAAPPEAGAEPAPKERGRGRQGRASDD